MGDLDGVFHFAALLAHGDVSDKDQWWVSVAGMGNILQCCRQFGVNHLVFTSSNCLWGRPTFRPLTEEETPCPWERYGQAKWVAENLRPAGNDVISAIIRTLIIIQAGRLGLLAILLEFISECRKIWRVGDATNRYQFIAASDLADASLRAITIEKTEPFNLTSDDAPAPGRLSTRD